MTNNIGIKQMIQAANKENQLLKKRIQDMGQLLCAVISMEGKTVDSTDTKQQKTKISFTVPYCEMMKIRPDTNMIIEPDDKNKNIIVNIFIKD